MQSIFLVEDDAKLAGLLTSYLNRNGFQVHVVDDFRQVLDDFLKVGADLVLSDAQAGGGSPWEAVIGHARQ